MRGKQRARQTEIPNWAPEELGLDAKLVGLKGSPTRVVKIERPSVTRKGVTLDVDKLGAEEAARKLVDYLEEKNLL